MKQIFAMLFALIVSLPSFAEVAATVNRTVIPSGETIQLRLQRDGSTDSQPDLIALKKDFDILGSGSGTNVEIINGHMSSKAQVTVLLSPKHSGKIQIPALQWDGEQSAPIELTVGGDASQQAQGENNSPHVFLTTSLDQKQPYVQAAVVLTVRLYSDQSLYQATLDFPASSDVIVKQFGKDKASNETKNGRNYQVIERKYLLFAQRSGKISLAGPVLDAEISDGSSNDPFGDMFKSLGAMMSQTRPLHLSANPIGIEVLPRPANITPWLPAQKMILEETWGQDKATIHVGEPLARHLHIAALGLTGEQLPDPNMLISLPDKIKAYPDQVSIADSPEGNTVMGSRDQDIALIATQAGHYVLPAVKLIWWDTVRNTRREAILPEEALDILPASNAAMPVPHEALPEPKLKAPELPGKAVPVWQWISMVLGLIGLATLLVWWWYPRRRVVPAQQADKEQAVIPASSAFKAFQQACHADDPHAVRRHLLAWASAIWRDDPPLGLNELSRRMKDVKVTDALRELDRACYTGKAWHGEGLALSMSEKPVQTAASKNGPVLPELYP